MGFGECVVLAVGAAFGNYLPMRVGTVVRTRYLKVVHGLRYARFGSIFGVRALLTVAATGALGLVGTVGVALAGGRLSLELLAAFGLLVLGSAGLYVGAVDRAVQLVMVAVFGGAGFAFMWWRSRQAPSSPSRP